ncbi:MAG: hypothetical protein EP297_06490 [Gammaproteobacteria bacterium]|nr:MAG: hypothetical protein EP297_06490 [Gammaproteobacteria bacterium]
MFITRFPLHIQHQFGKILGKILYFAGPRRRHIAAVNLQLCFPEMSDTERLQLLKKHFGFYGISIIESFAAWWTSPKHFEDKIEYVGLEHVHNALKRGKGVILLGSHFSTLEINGRMLGCQFVSDKVYRSHKNALFDTVMSNGRVRWNKGETIDRRDVRGIIRRLKANHVVWYAPELLIRIMVENTVSSSPSWG